MHCLAKDYIQSVANNLYFRHHPSVSEKMADAKTNELGNPPFYTIEIITHYKAIITPSLLKFINGDFSPHPKAKSYHIPLKSHRFLAKLQKARVPLTLDSILTSRSLKQQITTRMHSIKNLIIFHRGKMVEDS